MSRVVDVHVPPLIECGEPFTVEIDLSNPVDNVVVSLVDRESGREICRYVGVGREKTVFNCVVNGLSGSRVIDAYVNGRRIPIVASFCGCAADQYVSPSPSPSPSTSPTEETMESALIGTAAIMVEGCAAMITILSMVMIFAPMMYMVFEEIGRLFERGRSVAEQVHRR